MAMFKGFSNMASASGHGAMDDDLLPVMMATRLRHLYSARQRGMSMIAVGSSGPK